MTLISEEGVVGGSLSRENVIPGNIPVASHELISSIAPSNELEVAITNPPVELTRPSYLLAITQGTTKIIFTSLSRIAY